MQNSVLQMKVKLVLELCPKVFNPFFRCMCPWHKCWFLHLFYQTKRSIPKCGVS